MRTGDYVAGRDYKLIPTVVFTVSSLASISIQEQGLKPDFSRYVLFHKSDQLKEDYSPIFLWTM